MIRQFEEIKIKTPDDITDNIKRIEKMIRTSPEYKLYLSYIYEDLKIKNCDYFKKWGKDDEVDMEFHHIITLYDIIMLQGSLMLLNLKDNEYITTFDLAKEVILLHYEDLIPGIILSTTIHQAYHAGLYQLDKNSNSVNLGNYTEFIKRFSQLLNDNDIGKFTYFMNDSDKEAVTILWQHLKEINSQNLI